MQLCDLVVSAINFEHHVAVLTLTPSRLFLAGMSHTSLECSKPQSVKSRSTHLVENRWESGGYIWYMKSRRLPFSGHEISWNLSPASPASSWTTVGRPNSRVLLSVVLRRFDWIRYDSHSSCHVNFVYSVSTSVKMIIDNQQLAVKGVYSV